MAGEWHVKTLDQLGRVVTGKTPPSTILDAFGGHIPFVTPSDMDGARIISNTMRHLSVSGHAAVKNAAIPKGAVMVSCIGSDMGKAAIAGADCATNQQINSIIIDTDDSPLFVYYNLSSRKSEIRGSASGSAQPILNKSAFGRLEIELPSPAEQRAIAHILGTLDDKIELNRKQNETLEAMARALFKDWFVDFGPVRAKMEGREPYLPADLWQLFPDRLDDEGKPEGWKKMAAEVVADIGIGKTPPRKENQWFSASKSDVRWVSIRDMGNSGVFLQRTSEFLTRKAVEKFNVRVVPDNTVILSFKLTVGRVAITDGEMVTNEAIAHLKVRSDSGLSSEYVYSYLREFDYGRLGSTSSIATAVNSKSIKALPVLVPANDLAGWFSGRVTPIFARIKHLQSESESLAQLRDTLLPKLISGELRITDAEKLLERLV